MCIAPSSLGVCVCVCVNNNNNKSIRRVYSRVRQCISPLLLWVCVCASSTTTTTTKEFVVCILELGSVYRPFFFGCVCASSTTTTTTTKAFVVCIHKSTKKRIRRYCRMMKKIVMSSVKKIHKNINITVQSIIIVQSSYEATIKLSGRSYVLSPVSQL